MDDLLRGDGVTVRRYRDQDADDVAAACADPLSQRFLAMLPDPYTLADARWWISEGSPAAFAAGGGAWAVVDPRTDRLLGAVGLSRQYFDSAEIGYWVAPWARGRGVAAAALRTVAAHALAQGMRRLVVRTQPENAASQRVALAAGFSREGVARGAAPGRAGDRVDLIVWARLAGDPDRPTPRLLPDLPGRTGRDGGQLSDGVVALRPVTADDVEETYQLRILDDVVATSVPPQAPDRTAIERMIARADGSWLAGERAVLAIRDAPTGAYAGEIGLYYWEPPTQQAMIGYSLTPGWRGRGYATRAARLVCEWAFEQVGVVRVIAGTAPENVASQRVLERAGFVREGYQRLRLPGPGGRRIDDVLYARVSPQAQLASQITP